MTTTAVLFDMDGVLVDSAPLHVRAYEQVFRDAGLVFPAAAREAVREGKPRSKVIEIGAPAASPVTQQQLFDAKPNAVVKVLQSGQDVSMPGATQTVLALAAGGVPMGVVTNSGSPKIWLEAAGVLELMKVLVTRNDVSLPKPSPEGYLLAAKRLDVSPAGCIAFEDSHDGWLAATQAGMRAVVVATARPAWAETDTELVPTLDRAAVLALCFPTKVEGHI
ncbi:MAG: HAD family phosphatase [Deltaproteobacteria bacterium]|nr:HAD family phosphatase [Deltaproteobacteria bacterium]MBW2211106.1 HAD family phosphatase [Deltaproteobacteria bacterium]MBW2215295.1 HAD family phosphatase [Deltaproteobacteria bacterium]MBW2379105.1 HAD family phosphatase [Deltaproteobacteria bacterium]MBW2628887.1 HAD family phosphatase [Deltaproteobacteria bacterium]